MKRLADLLRPPAPKSPDPGDPVKLAAELDEAVERRGQVRGVPLCVAMAARTLDRNERVRWLRKGLDLMAGRPILGGPPKTMEILRGVPSGEKRPQLTREDVRQLLKRLGSRP